MYFVEVRAITDVILFLLEFFEEVEYFVYVGVAEEFLKAGFAYDDEVAYGIVSKYVGEVSFSCSTTVVADWF